MRIPSRSLMAPVSACLLLVFARPAYEQVAPSDEQAIQQLVTRLYEARAAKDIASYVALWAVKAPRRVAVNFPLEFVFPYARLQAGPASLTRLKQEATTLIARVAIDVTLTSRAGEPSRKERWIRNMGFVKEGDTWKIWRESPAAEDLAVEIATAKEDAREGLIASEPDLITEELALAIETQGDRQFASSMSNPRAARALFQLEMNIGERVTSAAAVARAHMKIAQILQLTSPDAAIEHFQKALEGFKAVNDLTRWAKTEEGLATSYYNRDNASACEHYQRASELFLQLDDKYALAASLHGYGNASYLVGDWSTALDAYHKSLALQETLPTRSGIPALLQAIGRVQKDQGDYDSAIASYEKSLADASYASQFSGMSGLGDVYRLQGRFELSVQQYGRALALAMARAARDNQGAMQVEADLGNTYLSAQQPVAALDHYKKSLALAETLRNQAGVARALAAIGLASFSDMQYEPAIEAYAKALPIREQMQDKDEVAWLHAHIGMAQSALERHEDALASYEKAFQISTEQGDAAAIAVMQALLASEHGDLDHAAQAIDLADRAAEGARAMENDDTLAHAQTIKARVLRKGGDRAGAESALQQAIAAVESGRERAGDNARNDFFGDTRGPYRAMAVLQAESGNTTDALVFAERSQLALLADVLTGNRSLLVNGLSGDEQQEEQRLNRDHKSLRVQVQKERERPKPDAGRLESLKAKLVQADAQRKAFAEKIYAAHPMLKLARGFIDAGDAGQLGAAVPDGNTAVVEFVTTEKQTLVLVITRKAGPLQVQSGVVDLKFLDLARRVREFRALIRQKDSDIGEAARLFYDTLLAPVRGAIAGKTRLVIVPDGPLWSLPFQALQSPDGRFLIQRCAVSYAPSLTALALVGGSSLAPAHASRARSVVVVANQQPGSAADRLKLLNAAANLSPMPNAEQEARRIAQVYGAGRAKVHAGGGATTLAAICGDAETAALLHLATFIVPNAASPLRSPIVFTVGKTGEAGIVEAWEMVRVSMPALSVVSRVNIDRVSNDGTVPVGLSWAFFVAGTKTMLTATWPDDSPAAASLMLGLHRNLLRPGKAAVPAGTALRQAILSLLATKYGHPFYWANYAVIGVE